MREIMTHKHNVCNEHITIEAVDSPGPGGANHQYHLTGYDSNGNPSSMMADGYQCSHSRTVLLFQNGPIGEVGVNGITNEALIAVVLDRLNGFQSGEWKCRENAMAITKLEEAMHWLLHRTRQREALGVEGTHEV